MKCSLCGKEATTRILDGCLCEDCKKQMPVGFARHPERLLKSVAEKFIEQQKRKLDIFWRIEGKEGKTLELGSDGFRVNGFTYYYLNIEQCRLDFQTKYIKRSKGIWVGMGIPIIEITMNDPDVIIRESLDFLNQIHMELDKQTLNVKWGALGQFICDYFYFMYVHFFPLKQPRQNRFDEKEFRRMFKGSYEKAKAAYLSPAEWKKVEQEDREKLDEARHKTWEKKHKNLSETEKAKLYYGIQEPFTLAELKKIRNEKLKECHPDDGGTSAKAGVVNDYYSILKKIAIDH